MNHEEVKNYLESFKTSIGRTIVIIDYGNVEKWKNSLKWSVGIKELGNLVKHFSSGKQFLRRFYYGSDYGASEKSQILVGWSRSVLDRAKMNRFEVITKRVKYIHSGINPAGFEKKCDLDVEMTVDLIRERDNYDVIILFSGDGDLMCAVQYLKENYDKKCIVMGARNHVGREVYDALNSGIVDTILYAEDFEYRLNFSNFKY
jgi:uncharacterized LabA/DUF88 family protein